MDIMLPGEDGYQLTTFIKGLGLPIPIIFLSARNDIESKLEGLTVGEDYMTKPFEPRELLLRMQKNAQAALWFFDTNSAPLD